MCIGQKPQRSLHLTHEHKEYSTAGRGDMNI
jgi:hypothetical protein